MKKEEERVRERNRWRNREEDQIREIDREEE